MTTEPKRYRRKVSEERVQKAKTAIDKISGGFLADASELLARAVLEADAEVVLVEPNDETAGDIIYQAGDFRKSLRTDLFLDLYEPLSDEESHG